MPTRRNSSKDSTNVSQPSKNISHNASIKGKKNHREIWCIDCETDPFKAGRIPAPFIWGAYNGVEYHEFAKGDELVNFLAERHCLVYAHNGGRFDYHFLLHAIPSDSPIMVINGRLAKFKIGNAEFRDSWNIFPAPQAMGADKLDVDWTIFEPIERDRPKNREIIKERLRIDCMGLYEIVQSFIDEFGLHLTQAGASVHAWSQLSGIPKPRTSRAFYDTFSPFYYGGRVECFCSGEIKRRFKIIDLNSAYPRAMQEKHPWGNTFTLSNELPKSRGAIERSFITLCGVSRGALPFRAQDGSLIFPNDRTERIYDVTGWEYLAALETGCLEKCTVLKVYTLPLAIDFNVYIDHFYKMKEEAKRGTPRYEFAKRFLNSLYGKFGADPSEYSEYKILPYQFIEAAQQTEGYLFTAHFAGRALVSRPLLEDQQHYLNVATAASITGYNRAVMHRGLVKVKEPMYCDTDAIWCRDTADLELHPTKLGAWDLEAECKYGAIVSKKMYAAETIEGKWKKACKGVKLDVEQIIRLARGEELVAVSDAPQFSVKNGIRFVDRRLRKTA